MKLQSIFMSLILASTAAQADVGIEAVKKAMPDVKNIQEVKTLAGGDLVEVRIGKSDIIYVTSDMHYAIKGHVLDLKTKKNLTQERIAELTKIDFGKLNYSNAIKIQRGNGSKKFASFEDPNCGYCKKLTKEVLSMDDVTVYVFLIPILGPDSEIKSKNIWCSGDQEKTYINWMTKNVTPPNADGDCDSGPIQANRTFALESGIRGTPAIVFPDGKVNQGVLTSKEIQQRL